MVAICDGCGVQADASSNGLDWFKPREWYQRSPPGEGRPIIACSRSCIDTIEAKRAEAGRPSTTVVLPI